MLESVQEDNSVWPPRLSYAVQVSPDLMLVQRYLVTTVSTRGRSRSSHICQVVSTAEWSQPPLNRRTLSAQWRHAANA